MSHASLAARYRPQTFADVTGQDTVKTILSRAAAEERVAPAYLLSGTRGVGKTTIARIFAKALNCQHAPCAEPCNQCEQCRRVTQGNHVDVVEIDGASNRGIDDARRLREASSYAPMEGRYKVFIIDEAHMLTRESFNALLKTLEEPPPRVTFILATTEAHKFPITIVSRCQHFVFKALPEGELAAHLKGILSKESIPFEDSAVHLLARRAAGSVRDGMSLMGQTLALGGDNLTESATRSVLGLAGQELYEQLLKAFKVGDCVGVAGLTHELLEHGVDLGFFLRELATLWRNLFLLRQAGESASSLLDVPESEKRRLIELAPQFELEYIHAAWQMVLEGQRQVLTSLEPSVALELMLLNLALLPRLVSLETISRQVPSAPLMPAPATGAPSAPPPRATLEKNNIPEKREEPESPKVFKEPEKPEKLKEPEKPVEFVEFKKSEGSAESENAERSERLPEPEDAERSEGSAEAVSEENDDPLDWKSFLAYCDAQHDDWLGFPFPALQQAIGRFAGENLVLVTSSSFQYEQLATASRIDSMRQMASGYADRPFSVSVLPPTAPGRTEADWKRELTEHPLVKSLEEHFNATLLRCIPLENQRNRS